MRSEESSKIAVGSVCNQFGDCGSAAIRFRPLRRVALVFRRLWDWAGWRENELADKICDGRVLIERCRAPLEQPRQVCRIVRSVAPAHNRRPAPRFHAPDQVDYEFIRRQLALGLVDERGYATVLFQ
jgi:hypothetical protein